MVDKYKISGGLLGGLRRLGGMNAWLINPKLCHQAADDIERLEILIEELGGPTKSTGPLWKDRPAGRSRADDCAYFATMTIAEQIRHAPRPLFPGAEKFGGNGRDGIFGVDPNLCSAAESEIFRLVKLANKLGSENARTGIEQ